MNTADVAPLIDTQGITVLLDLATDELGLDDPFAEIRLGGHDRHGTPLHPLHFTPKQAVELARRLLNIAATLD